MQIENIEQAFEKYCFHFSKSLVKRIAKNAIAHGTIDLKYVDYGTKAILEFHSNTKDTTFIFPHRRIRISYGNNMNELVLISSSDYRLLRKLSYTMRDQNGVIHIQKEMIDKIENYIKLLEII